MIDVLFDESRNLDVLAAPNGAKLRVTLNLLAETNATSAMNAACHVGGYQRADILVFYDALAIVVA